MDQAFYGWLACDLHDEASVNPCAEGQDAWSRQRVCRSDDDGILTVPLHERGQ